MSIPDAERNEPGAEQRGLNHALEQFNERISELYAYTRYLGRVRLDALESRARRTAIKVAYELFGALGFTALTFVLVLYCVQASAMGLAAWASWPPWAGKLVVAFTGLVVIIAFAALWRHRCDRAHLRRRQKVYDEHVREQQARFDRSVRTAAARDPLRTRPDRSGNGHGQVGDPDRLAGVDR
jgi:hypothetical protein